MSFMRIGVDLSAYRPESSDGVSTFSLGLVEGFLANESENIQVVLLVSKANQNFFSKLFSDRNIQLILISIPRSDRYLNRLIWIFSWLVREYRLRYWYELWFRRRLIGKIELAVDALVVPTTVFNFFALGIPTIVCVHDIQHEYHPENFTVHQRMLRWASYRLSCARATAVQVSSRYIHDCLLEKFKFLSPEKLFIAPEGVDTDRFSIKAHDRVPANLPELARQKFIFYPAQIWRHKNHALLMQALAIFRTRMGFEMPCVLTGHDYGHWSNIEKIRAVLELDAIYYLGRVDFAELLWLYKHCDAVLALGLHESSSLPVREGASFGKPLICADILPNVESAEYLHLNLFQQDSPEALADKLVALCQNQTDIQRLATMNADLVTSLRWNVIAPSYINRLSSRNTGQSLVDRP